MADWNTARSVTLVAAANLHLAGHATGNYWPHANIFQVTDTVRFAGPPGREDLNRAETDAGDPNVWFDKLRRIGARGVLLADTWENPPSAAARSTEALRRKPFAIVEVVDGATDLWRESGENPESGGVKGWSATYVRQTAGGAHRPSPPDMAGALRSMDAVLSALIPFTRRNGLTQFSPSFEQALTCLRDDQPLADNWYLKGYEYLLPDLNTQRLFAAATAAHVFGGMGSWNDSGAEREPDEFNRLTERLVASLRNAAVAAANSTFHWP
ncbi:MAG TPA: hypothetical protein VHZ29_01830 [Rhizomicrobium sp.]|nr:hypothetical protein [Rhizomicrobium sp.]